MKGSEGLVLSSGPEKAVSCILKKKHFLKGVILPKSIYLKRYCSLVRYITVLWEFHPAAFHNKILLITGFNR